MRVEVLPPSIVVDAGVGLKWVVNEPGSAAAVTLLPGWLVLIPSLFWVEAANALATKSRRGELDRSDALDAWRDLVQAPLEVLPLNPDSVRSALEIAQDLGHPVYDCCYLAAALDLGTLVITADRRFCRAVELVSDPRRTRCLSGLDRALAPVGATANGRSIGDLAISPHQFLQKDE